MLAGPYRPAPSPADLTAETGGILRPKGTLSRAELSILTVLAALPLLAITLRMVALPGFTTPEGGGFWGIGSVLNQLLSLSDVPPQERDHVLYLLFVPTCALLVAFARLTFGLRVLGFRSILIAVAFQESGVVASLLLITVAIVTVLLLRPWLRRIRLPYYARVSVILCVVSVTMVGALLVGPWMRSDLAWGMAYFPVIVMGMLAEGIARTVDRDDGITASWLAVNTILLAFLMALICQVPVLRSFMLRFPEIVLTQIVAIVMISEYLDLRWLQHWDKKIAGMLLPRSRSRSRAFHVAVVRNRIETESQGRVPQQALRSVQKIVDVLRGGGYRVTVVEGDTSLLKELRRFFPLNPTTGELEGMVLNLAHGIQGDARTTHVPAVLEMSGIAYSGPTPLGHAMIFDPVVAKVLMQLAGIPTPAFRLLTKSRGAARGLLYPVTVRPRHEPLVRPKMVTDRRQLEAAVNRTVRRYRQEAFVEEVITGRRISVALLGNDPVECLPLVEVDLKRRAKICPAPVDESVAERIREYAQAAFRACGCRDYARVDLRLGESAGLWVAEVRTLGVLASEGSFVRAGMEAGYTFQDLICRIVDVARSRSHSKGRLPRQRKDETEVGRSPRGVTTWNDSTVSADTLT
ncbi:MAG TPA: 7TM domain-containing protein [Candidatus Limnocylindria bacterium]|nr:7TM domain-containing protein [Candidatus Limnocylindria bacterium]